MGVEFLKTGIDKQIGTFEMSVVFRSEEDFSL